MKSDFIEVIDGADSVEIQPEIDVIEKTKIKVNIKFSVRYLQIIYEIS